MNKLISVLFLVIILTSCTNKPSFNADYAITNVRIVDVKNGELSVPSDVLIAGDTIQFIKPSEDQDYGEIEIIDGTNKFLSPGLAEMHAHIPTGNNNDLVEETLFLYLSNGVTTIRGMLGAPQHLSLREQVDNGEILGPRIFTSGPSINGNTAPNPEVARQMVIDQEKAGYDFLKMHPGITLEVFNEIDRVADSVGIGFSGHVSVWVGIRNALKAKYGSIDHIDGYFEGLVPNSAEVEPNENGFFGFNFTEIVDESLIDELVTLTKENKVWVVATHCLLERWVGPEDPEILGNQPEMKYMSPGTREGWINSKKRFMSGDHFSVERSNEFLRIRDEILNDLYKGGAGLLLGSDAPQVFNVPGFSIQHELKSMIDAGIPEIDVIKSGTINPAKFFDMENTFGSVDVGKSADLILLNENPVEDISAFENREGVMVRGKWMSKELIEERLNAIAEKYSK